MNVERFKFICDDEDIEYNLNRESNREYGKQYYSMKEEKCGLTKFQVN